jgi:SAM-dependent methyltransferase
VSGHDHGAGGPRHDDPWAVSTGEAIAFLERALADRPKHTDAPAPALLDIGAGQGRIAAALAARGWRVRAIEPNPESAAIARARSADLKVDELDAVADEGTPRTRALAVPGGYGAAFFGRSLHHVSDPERALRFAQALLAPSGRVVLEEFTWDRADRATAAWFFERWDRAEAAGRLEPRDADDGPDPGGDPLARWRHGFEHDPPLLTGDRMLAAVRACAKGAPAIEDAAGLYRFFEQRSLTPDAAWIRSLLAEERAALAAGAIRPIGLRVVFQFPGGIAC